MDFTVVFGVMLLFMEISTTYVSMRWLLYKHHLSRGPLYAINAVALFLFFLFGRLFYQVYITFWIGGPLVANAMEKKSLTFYQGIVILEMTVMVILSLVLNLYWFYLMIAMICRLVGRMKQTEDEENENVELVKADGLKDKDDEEVGDKST